jgi:uncharacterized protein
MAALKLILTLLVVFIGLAWWNGRRRGEVAAAKAPARPSQAMVCCARCGLHLPQAEAIAAQAGLYYCGRDHQALGPAAAKPR